MYWKATDLVYFSSTSQQILLYPFVLVMICVLGVLDDLLCVVQPQELWRCKDWLHVRSPQDLPLIVASCWLDLDRQRGEEVRVMECAFLRVPCTRPFLAPPTTYFGRNSFLGYSWPLFENILWMCLYVFLSDLGLGWALRSFPAPRRCLPLSV